MPRSLAPSVGVSLAVMPANVAMREVQKDRGPRKGEGHLGEGAGPGCFALWGPLGSR